MRFVVADTIIAACALFVWLAVFDEVSSGSGSNANFLSGSFLSLLVFACCWRVVLSAKRWKQGG